MLYSQVEVDVMNDSFGTKLRDYRRVAKISQRELAERTGLDFSYISKLENDRIPPPAADTIVAICQVLEIPAEELLALTGKLPSKVQQNISTSKAAQTFLREAEEMGLTDNDWERIGKALRNLKGRRR